MSKTIITYRKILISRIQKCAFFSTQISFHCTGRQETRQIQRSIKLFKFKALLCAQTFCCNSEMGVFVIGVLFSWDLATRLLSVAKTGYVLVNECHIRPTYSTSLLKWCTNFSFCFITFKLTKLRVLFTTITLATFIIATYYSDVIRNTYSLLNGRHTYLHASTYWKPACKNLWAREKLFGDLLATLCLEWMPCFPGD